MTSQLLSDVAAIIDRVRCLEASASRAAALQCLADARFHLERATSHRPSSSNLQTRQEADQAFRNAREILKGIAK